jgi:hypothetical protein
VAGCPVQLEPPSAEPWRSNPDAQAFARDHAAGWTYDPVRQTDYCPSHAAFSTAPDIDAAAPHPTATARDHAGNPLNRDEYAARLRIRLSESDQPSMMLTSSEAVVVARLLDELAGVYRGEVLGTLASDMSKLLSGRG